MKGTRLHLSVVIPAYNEAELIGKCLKALTEQTRKADEIIVVDNNSSDETAAIAASFPRVKVVKEKRQGVTYAKYSGFDRAHGEIIAQLDADSIVAPTWCEKLMDAFESDPSIDAATGGASIAELSPENKFWFKSLIRLFRLLHQFWLGIDPMMYGYNCALRRKIWLEIRHEVTIGSPISDDIEVAICLLKSKKRIVFLPGVIVKIGVLRSATPKKQRNYFRNDNITLVKHEYGRPLRRKIAELML